MCLSFLFRFFLSDRLFTDRFLLLLCQQLFIPACIATVRHFTGNGDIMLFVDTEKIP